MKTMTQNTVRAEYLDKITEFFSGLGEDVGQIASNSINFPIVAEGEEGWIEIVVKIPKEDEGYEKRDEYVRKGKEKEIKEAKKEAEKQAKIAKDEAKRKEKEAKKNAST